MNNREGLVAVLLLCNACTQNVSGAVSLTPPPIISTQSPAPASSPTVLPSQVQLKTSQVAQIDLDSIPSAICFDKEGQAWIVCRSLIYHFDKRYQQDKKFSIDYDFPSKAQVGSTGNLFINDKRGYIHELDSEGNEVRRFDAQSSDIAEVRFLVSQDETIWASHDFSTKTFLYDNKGGVAKDLQIPATIDYFEVGGGEIVALSVDLVTKLDRTGRIISQIQLADAVSCGDVDNSGNIWTFSPSDGVVEEIANGTSSGKFKADFGTRSIIANASDDIWTMGSQGIKLYNRSGSEKLAVTGSSSVFAVSPLGLIFQGQVDQVGKATLRVLEVMTP